MLGRMAMQNIWLFRHVDEAFFNTPGPHLTRRQVVERYCDYVEKLCATHRRRFSSLVLSEVETDERRRVQTAHHIV